MENIEKKFILYVTNYDLPPGSCRTWSYLKKKFFFYQLTILDNYCA